MTADLALEAGSATALIGPSGSGKSTLLNAIAGFIAPARGRILWDGRDITGLAPAERPVTLLFQEHNLFAHLTAAQNVGLGLRPDLRLDRGGLGAGRGGAGGRRAGRARRAPAGAALGRRSASGWRWRGRCCAAGRSC